MAFELSIFGRNGNGEALDAEYLEWLVDERWPEIQTHFGKLWEYYANLIVDLHRTSTQTVEHKAGESGKCYVQAQEYGLPARITGVARCAEAGVFGGRPIGDIQRKEVVIENDISWRINAAVDFLFGKPISVVSRAADGSKRAEIDGILKAVFSANGGIGFFQDMAVLGGVYGFVDCMVRPGREIYERISKSSTDLRYEVVPGLAQAIGLELIEAPRALPVLDENDYRKVIYYVQHFQQARNHLAGSKGILWRLLGKGADRRQVISVTEVTSAQAWQRYEDKELVAEGENPWGFLPVVHIQNLAQPFYYEGQSDVEPLVPIQDELNTRLSDRASRITMQSFKMYLGKGIEGFAEKPVSPGVMWHTDNPDASIEEFGGDEENPSESHHITEIREAMDKISGVTPLVAGVIRSKLGNLTSAVALKLTLMGMLSKTERKRFTYGEGLKEISRMVLEILDKANIYRTSEQDRDVEIIFPNPLPENVMEKLEEAKAKKELGVPAEQVLKELGYGTSV
ncbi:MAG: phage portal protein [Sedimentisphaerales bacterium]|nr:phage portal protein [Sedimentisphaerales bacterium]